MGLTTNTKLGAFALMLGSLSAPKLNAWAGEKESNAPAAVSPSYTRNTPIEIGDYRSRLEIEIKDRPELVYLMKKANQAYSRYEKERDSDPYPLPRPVTISAPEQNFERELRNSVSEILKARIGRDYGISVSGNSLDQVLTEIAVSIPGMKGPRALPYYLAFKGVAALSRQQPAATVAAQAAKNPMFQLEADYKQELEKFIVNISQSKIFETRFVGAHGTLLLGALPGDNKAKVARAFPAAEASIRYGKITARIGELEKEINKYKKADRNEDLLAPLQVEQAQLLHELEQKITVDIISLSESGQFVSRSMNQEAIATFSAWGVAITKALELVSPNGASAFGRVVEFGLAWMQLAAGPATAIPVANFVAAGIGILGLIFGGGQDSSAQFEVVINRLEYAFREELAKLGEHLDQQFERQQEIALEILRKVREVSAEVKFARNDIELIRKVSEDTNKWLERLMELSEATLTTSLVRDAGVVRDPLDQAKRKILNPELVLAESDLYQARADVLNFALYQCNKGALTGASLLTNFFKAAEGNGLATYEKNALFSFMQSKVGSAGLGALAVALSSGNLDPSESKLVKELANTTDFSVAIGLLVTLSSRGHGAIEFTQAERKLLLEFARRQQNLARLVLTKERLEDCLADYEQKFDKLLATIDDYLNNPSVRQSLGVPGRLRLDQGVDQLNGITTADNRPELFESPSKVRFLGKDSINYWINEAKKLYKQEDLDRGLSKGLIGKFEADFGLNLDLFRILPAFEAYYLTTYPSGARQEQNPELASLKIIPGNVNDSLGRKEKRGVSSSYEEVRTRHHREVDSEERIRHDLHYDLKKVTREASPVYEFSIKGNTGESYVLKVSVPDSYILAVALRNTTKIDQRVYSDVVNQMSARSAKLLGEANHVLVNITEAWKEKYSGAVELIVGRAFPILGEYFHGRPDRAARAGQITDVRISVNENLAGLVEARYGTEAWFPVGNFILDQAVPEVLKKPGFTVEVSVTGDLKPENYRNNLIQKQRQGSRELFRQILGDHSLNASVDPKINAAIEHLEDSRQILLTLIREYGFKLFEDTGFLDQLPGENKLAGRKELGKRIIELGLIMQTYPELREQLSAMKDNSVDEFRTELSLIFPEGKGVLAGHKFGSEALRKAIELLESKPASSHGLSGWYFAVAAALVAAGGIRQIYKVGKRSREV